MIVRRRVAEYLKVMIIADTEDMSGFGLGPGVVDYCSNLGNIAQGFQHDRVTAYNQVFPGREFAGTEDVAKSICLVKA